MRINEPPEHPVARLFPDMDPGEFAILKFDIRDNGLKVPILLWRGQLIDGRHRLRACRELGIEPRFETVDCREEELAGLVWSLNRLRRQLTTSQRAMIANAISMYSERGRPKELPGPATPMEERADINARVVQLAAEDKIRINCKRAKVW
jgi:ParB-like nuclease domain